MALHAIQYISMRKRAEVVIAISVLLASCVVLLCVLPAFSLPETALRASHAARATMLAMVVSVCLSFFISALRAFAFGPGELLPQPAPVSVVDLTCTRRC